MNAEKLQLTEFHKDRVIIQITDTHLMDRPEAEFVGINPEENFHAVMDDIKQQYRLYIQAILRRQLFLKPMTVTLII